MKGVSGVCWPIYPSNKKSKTNNQKKIWCKGRYKEDRIAEVLINGSVNKTKIDANNATTPNNLLGIDRKIAYEGKKYHSGTICSGVTIAFAGI